MIRAMLRWMMALPLVACASSAASTSVDGAVAPSRDASCSGERGPSRVEGIDPATGCPRLVVVEHRWSAPRVCERIEPGCSAPAACRFPVRLVAPALPGCSAQGIDTRYEQCRCEFGVVECAGRAPVAGDWPGCVASNILCYDCAR